MSFQNILWKNIHKISATHNNKMYVLYIRRMAEMTLLISIKLLIHLQVSRESADPSWAWQLASASSCKLMRQLCSAFLASPWTSGLTIVQSHGTVESEDNKPHSISKFQVSACTTSTNTPLTKVVLIANPLFHTTFFLAAQLPYLNV